MMNLFVSVVVILVVLYFLINHTLGFILFGIAAVLIYLMKGVLFTSTTAIIASVVGVIFLGIFVWIGYRPKKDENPEKVDETFSIVYGLTKENARSFITESLKVLGHQYKITDLIIDENSLDNINRIKIKCYKNRREVNILNLIFEEDKAYIRSVNKIIDISRLLYCLKFENNLFTADLSKSQQIYSNTCL